MLSIEGEVDPAGVQAVERLLAGGVCRAARYVAATESTNSLAIAEMLAHRVDADELPKLVLADSQTAGRGRHGRTWISSPGTLTFSLVIQWRLDAGRRSRLLSMAVGLGVARGLEFDFAPIQARLKWPNDVYLSGGKVVGILLETSPSISNRVIIGIGVNVGGRPDLSGDPTASPTQCVAAATGRSVHRYDLLDSLVAHVRQAIEQLDLDSDGLVTEFRSRCLLTGHSIGFQERGVQTSGTCRGISDDGELIVQTEAGTRRLQSGDARLLRIRR